MKTYAPKPDHIERSWYVVDASGMVLGRLASEVAALLRGKHKPIFAPHMDCGDHVIVINADKITLSGAKAEKKLAHRHSGYPGGITSTSYAVLMADKPTFVIEKAVKGMLPKNRLGRAMVKKLHVVAGADHPHGAQQPVPYTLGQPPVWTGLPEPKLRLVRPVEPAPASVTVPVEEAPEPAAAPEPSAAEPTAPEAGASSTTPAAKKTVATKPVAAKKTVATKTAAKKATATKTAAKKTAAKKPAAKKTTAKKTAAKKTTAKKTTATKSAAKKPSAPEAE
jgi:large subunit ribosomal protein L13